MKTIVVMLTAFSISLTAFAPVSTYNDDARVKASRQLAVSVVEAFRRQSVEAYLTLFPSVLEFQKIMEMNGKEYGPFLREAQDQFAIDYSRTILPTVQETFFTIIGNGKNKNIDWSNIQLDGIELGESGDSLSIVIAYGEKHCTLVYEKVLHINGQLKVSQFVKLV